MSKPLLRVSGIHTYYGASHVLRDVDFSIFPGQTVGLMGRNGMGKSTLLKTITGLLKPKRGRIEFQDTAIDRQAPYDIAMLGMAYVPEGRGIFGNLSVHENLVMAERAGLRGQKDWTYQRVLDTFPRLAERLQHGGQQLSGGEQQMLAIARALMAKPWEQYASPAQTGPWSGYGSSSGAPFQGKVSGLESFLSGAADALTVETSEGVIESTVLDPPSAPGGSRHQVRIGRRR